MKLLQLLHIAGLLLLISCQTEENTDQKDSPEKRIPREIQSAPAFINPDTATQAGATATGNAIHLTENTSLDSTQNEIKTLSGILPSDNIFPQNDSLKWPTSDSLNPQPSFYWIDQDGDGFGIGSTRGEDWNEEHPHLHGSMPPEYLGTWLKRKGIDSVERIFMIYPYGSEAKEKSKFKQSLPNLNSAEYVLDEPFFMEKFSDSLRAGDVVIFRAGTYNLKRQQAVFKSSGLSKKPIVLMAWPGEKVTFTPQKTQLMDSLEHWRLIGLEWYNSKDSASALEIRNSRFIRLENCVFRNNVQIGLRLQAARDIHFEQCILRKHTKTALLLEDSSSALVQESLLYHNATPLISLDSNSRVHFENSTLH
jgi:hypothetical protein